MLEDEVETAKGGDERAGDAVHHHHGKEEQHHLAKESYPNLNA